MTFFFIAHICLGVIILMILHELGHVITAKLLGLKVYAVGIQWKPYPHFFVAAEWPKKQSKRLIYLFSGTFITLLLFISCYSVGWFGKQYIYYAFVAQLIIESNPFYSDFTIAVITHNKFDASITKSYATLYKERFLAYQFSYQWYLHFICWIILILILVKI